MSTSGFNEAFSNYFTGSKGAKHINRALSQEEIYIHKTFYGFIEIERCLERLEQIEVFLKNYSDCLAFRKKGITRAVYLKYHIEKYLDEIYILKERLCAFLKIIARSNKGVRIGAEKHLDELAITIRKSFEGIINTRGSHTHQNRFTEEDINRLESFDLLLKVGSMPKYFETFAKKETNKVYKTWLGTIRKNDKELKTLVNHYFVKIYPLVFNKKSQHIAP